MINTCPLPGRLVFWYVWISCLVFCRPPIIFLPDRQPWAKYLPGWRWIQFPTLSMSPRTWWLAHWLWLYWQMVMSWINLVVDSFQFVPKKCGNQSAFCELYVSQSEEGSRLGDDLGCASSGWWARARRWQPLTRQAALNFTTADCSANGSVPVVSRWAAMRVSTVYICKSFSIVSSQNELGKDDDTEKVQIWCRRKSPDKMTCWEVANWTELLYWGCLKLVSRLLKRSKKPRRRKNALEGRWERDEQDVGCWTFTCSAK